MAPHLEPQYGYIPILSWSASASISPIGKDVPISIVLGDAIRRHLSTSLISCRLNCPLKNDTSPFVSPPICCFRLSEPAVIPLACHRHCGMCFLPFPGFRLMLCAQFPPLSLQVINLRNNDCSLNSEFRNSLIRAELGLTNHETSRVALRPASACSLQCLIACIHYKQH